VTHWTQVLADISMVEFVALAVLTFLQWALHRTRGAGWAALAFAILGGVALALKVDPSMVSNQDVAKLLIAFVLLMPYCLFRFVASFERPGPAVRGVAAGFTAGIIAFTFALQYLPREGYAPPPHFVAYRAAFFVQFGFLLAYVVIRLLRAGVGEPPIAAARMRLLSVAVLGLEVQVVVVALGLTGTGVRLASQVLAVVMGVLFLTALVLPSFLRVVLSRKEDQAFRRALSELVAAGKAYEVAERLLPHVCALVGASQAALLSRDGTVVARYPSLQTAEGTPWEGGDGRYRRDGRIGRGGRGGWIVVRTNSGTSHELAVLISPYMPYFGGDELHKLGQLAGMVGLAIERCEMAEAMAYQASHDGLTGLANRSLFVERLADALSHVGRRRSELAVLFIDLDRFKLVNDRADHTAGDLVLHEMANRLATMTRGVDVVARFGGDEFVAFAEVDHEEDALDMAERIRRGLMVPIAVRDMHLSVTASVGVVVTSDGSASPGQVLRDADDAMYAAKRAGRDQVVLYRPNAQDVALQKWGMGRTRPDRATAG
jgi:diguanylate cyclase (GGDEF)-like protein